MNYNLIQECDLKLIGQGTSRKVYELSDEKVIKYPINKMGILQNEMELFIYNKYKNTKYEPLICPSYSIQNNNGLIMDKAITLPLLKDITIADYLKENYPHIIFPDRNLLSNFIRDASLHSDDIYISTAWGIINNNIRITDYGCTVDIFQQYYEW